MIITENINIRGKEYVKTYSDAGMMIAREGKKYSVAIEPIRFVRQYTETDKPIPTRKPAEPIQPQEEATEQEAAETENLENIETKEETTE